MGGQAPSQAPIRLLNGFNAANVVRAGVAWGWAPRPANTGPAVIAFAWTQRGPDYPPQAQRT